MKKIVTVLLLLGSLSCGNASAESGPASLVRPIDGNIRLLDVKLINQHGEMGRFSDVIRNAQVTVINFSYTGCRTVCPLSNIVMQQLETSLNDNLPGPRPKLITLTIDPLQDSPQVMRENAEQFGAGKFWDWYSGDPADVFAVLDGLNFRFGNLADHPQRYLIIDSRRNRYLLLPDEVTAEQLREFATALAKPSE